MDNKDSKKRTLFVCTAIAIAAALTFPAIALLA